MIRDHRYGAPRALLPLLCLAAAGSAAAQSPAVSGGPDVSVPPRGTFAIEDVDVLTMEPGANRPLADRVVVIADGKVAAVLADEAEAPPDVAALLDRAERIDGAGCTLMPGLAEMHGHLPGGHWPEAAVQRVLFLYLANGVTLVRGMLGDPFQLELRHEIAEGRRLGPRLLVGSPALSGPLFPPQAQKLVASFAEEGYDHVKVHEGLSTDAFDAIAAAAKERDMRFGGHVSDFVGLKRALQAGQSTIDHMDGVIEALACGLDAPLPGPQQSLAELVDDVELERCGSIADALKRSGAAVVPTQALWQHLFGGRGGDELTREMPETRYVLPETVAAWRESADAQKAALAGSDAGLRLLELRDQALVHLANAGVPVLLGTDSPQIFSVPGFSIHREVKALERAGLSREAILRAGTRAVADHYGAAGAFGTVTIGARADLLLLEGNPLDDLAELERRRGVFVDGRWLPQARIQAALEAFAAQLAAG